MRKPNGSIRMTLVLVISLCCTFHVGWAQEKKSPPTVYLRLMQAEMPKYAAKIDYFKPNASDVLVHELCRQSALLAARDLGSLVIRDEGMSDPEPGANDPSVHFLAMNISYRPDQTLDMKLESRKQLIWDNHLDLDSQVHHIVQLTRYLEEKSRTDLAGAFKKEFAAVQGRVNKPKQLNQKEIAELLNDFCFLPQFDALRQLHTADNQNDPKTLTSLAQAYAQLALLSRYHWTHLHRVCQARSLLYAQRLWSLNPGEKEKAVFATCLSLAGYHAAALKLYEEVEQANGKLDAFATAGKLLAKMDYETLEANGKKADESFADLSSYLAFRIQAREPTYSILGLTVPAQKLGIAIVEKKPESYPVIHRLCANNILGLRHHMTVQGPAVMMQTLPKRMKAMAGMPDSVQKTELDANMIREYHVELLKAGKADTYEPSWASVGNTILQTFFHQAHQRAMFMLTGWSVPTKEYLDEVMPLLANHPQAILVRLAGGDKEGIAGQVFIYPKAGDIRSLDMAIVARPLLGEQGGINQTLRMIGQCPQSADDTVLLNEVATDYIVRYELTKSLVRESPFHPMTAANYLNSKPEEFVTQFPDHAERFGKHIPYLYQYSDWKMRGNQVDEAEKTLKKLVEKNPNDASYQSLAKLYIRKNDRKKWEETLEAYLQHTTDMGLQPATVRLELAEYHAGQRNWDKAKKHAADAAETYAAWALFRASRVFELSGDFKQAEEYVKNMSLRYPEAAHQWFRWCLRTGRGEKDAAFKHFKNHIGENKTLSSQENLTMGMCMECMNQPKEAITYYAKSYASDPHIQSGLRLVILEGELGNKAARDEWMKKILVPNKKYAADVNYKNLLKVGELVFQSYQAETAPNVDVVETVLEYVQADLKPYHYYLLGKLCEQLKNVESAKKIYQLGLDTKGQATWGWHLCVIRLRALNSKE